MRIDEIRKLKWGDKVIWNSSSIEGQVVENSYVSVGIEWNDGLTGQYHYLDKAWQFMRRN